MGRAIPPREVRCGGSHHPRQLRGRVWGRAAAVVSGTMDLFPAIDVHDRGAVRLVRGDFGRVRGYGDPVALARSYVEGGARWIHVVDLDAARTGEPVNRDGVLQIAAAVDVHVEAGGGVRGTADAVALLDHGVQRVVVGTAAFETPDLVESLAQR